MDVDTASSLARSGGPSAASALPTSVLVDYEKPLQLDDHFSHSRPCSVTPTGSCEGSGPYEMIIPASSDFTTLNDMYLETTVKVTRADNQACTAAADAVGTVNLLASALWESIELHLNDNALTSANSSYTHYKSYIETMLSNDPSVADLLREQLYHRDPLDKDMLVSYRTEENTPKTEAETDEAFTARVKTLVEGDNPAFRKRAQAVLASRELTLTGPICVDFLRAVHHVLGPYNKLTFRFHRAKDAFVLCSDTNVNYRLHVTAMRLHFNRLVPKVPLSSGLKMEKYLVPRTELRLMGMGVGDRAKSFNLQTNNVVPKSIVFAFVSTEAFIGSQRLNPFRFRHFNVSNITLKIDGTPFPSEPYAPNFTSVPPRLCREYRELLRNVGCFTARRATMIDPERFQNGLTMFAYDLTPDRCNGLHVHPSKAGCVTVDFTMSEELPVAINVLAYCVYDDVAIQRRDDEGRVTSFALVPL